MRTIIQRVCWNTRGWQLPAGSTDEKGFPGEKGFGHEEWNFQFEDEFNGLIYGYTYTSPSIDKNDTFRLYFYAIHPVTKFRLLVGCYKEAKLVNESEYKGLLYHFQLNNIIKRRAQELIRVVPSMSIQAASHEIESSIKESWLNVKCQAEFVQIFDPPLKLPIEIGGKKLSQRFRMFSYIDEDQLLLELQQKPTPQTTNVRVDLAEDGYFRENRENLKEIIPRHNLLSNSLCQWLEKRNIIPTQEKQGVDVEFAHDGVSYRVEIKITYGAGLRHSIREAIGQLLEYNLFPGRQRCDKWVVLLDCRPDKEHLQYVETLRREFSLPLYLGWKSKKGFEFCDTSLSEF